MFTKFYFKVCSTANNIPSHCLQHSIYFALNGSSGKLSNFIQNKHVHGYSVKVLLTSIVKVSSVDELECRPARGYLNRQCSKAHEQV